MASPVFSLEIEMNGALTVGIVVRVAVLSEVIMPALREDVEEKCDSSGESMRLVEGMGWWWLCYAHQCRRVLRNGRLSE